MLFIALQLIYVLFSCYVFARSIPSTEEPQKSRLRYFFLLLMITWLVSWTNWCYFYDALPIPPMASPLITCYLVASSYLIFKRDIFSWHLVVQKTLIYALLTLCLTLIYTECVIFSEKVFQRWIGYSSLVGSLLAGLTIAVVFNPLRGRIIKVVDRCWFGKTILELSTENQRMKEELLKQDRLRAVATLAAGMAHEIRNPLTSIKVFADCLPTRYDEPEFRTEFRQAVMGEVQRINDILQQLLEFSKPRPPVLKATCLVPLVEETLHFLRSSLCEHHIEVTTRYEADPVLLLDQHQIRQALLNILLNSIQAMPEGGSLRIQTAMAETDALCITVADTGLGISKEHVAHVFDPFFTTKEEGTGLGLAIVHSIMTQHHGTVRLTSQAGQGTTVQVMLKPPPAQPA